MSNKKAEKYLLTQSGDTCATMKSNSMQYCYLVLCLQSLRSPCYSKVKGALKKEPSLQNFTRIWAMKFDLDSWNKSDKGNPKGMNDSGRK